jgi:hypothetical protein
MLLYRDELEVKCMLLYRDELEMTDLPEEEEKGAVDLRSDESERDIQQLDPKPPAFSAVEAVTDAVLQDLVHDSVQVSTHCSHVREQICAGVWLKCG